MRDRDWKRRFLADLDDINFQQAMRFHLQEIREAEDLPERQSAAGAYGGFRRNTRSRVRCDLARAMMEQLHITPTLHVAKFVMRQAFGMAASNEELDRRFAKTGRDATEKFMDEARKILASRPDQVARYGGLYEWFCRAEKRTARQIQQRMK